MASLQQSRLTLVSGPVKSGKSKWAEQILQDYSNVTYVATLFSDKEDINWLDRISKHKQRRPSSWKLIENIIDLNSLFAGISSNEPILIDSLGGIILKYLNYNDYEWTAIESQFLRLVQTFTNHIVLVIEEVGWGISPPTIEANLFRDRLGELVHKLEYIAHDSWLVLHGRAINLTDIGSTILL
ncbi:bifunctional adenosylcobinamide kinase/adenosylcobinamide-phosphate guanylyltransferase [Prochlorococcus marinus]|uniref:Adenosylcobinamide kinase n=1 Tax=Prochlorococcus marinus (strain MIT 9211) TaxID=93059 RepID=A9BAH0_PROM4|nr:bifunctional adenosylcobinamide kinase/adenosylcobinamide-phosphate guanylyltransferase [Prochlorococcus marinus]ABX08832.1 putative cobinamide kinase [Prochlorococcus marinus str. MIT 9211]